MYNSGKRYNETTRYNFGKFTKIISHVVSVASSVLTGQRSHVQSLLNLSTQVRPTLSPRRAGWRDIAPLNAEHQSRIGVGGHGRTLSNSPGNYFHLGYVIFRSAKDPMELSTYYNEYQWHNQFIHYRLNVEHTVQNNHSWLTYDLFSQNKGQFDWAWIRVFRFTRDFPTEGRFYVDVRVRMVGNQITLSDSRDDGHTWIERRVEFVSGEAFINSPGYWTNFEDPQEYHEGSLNDHFRDNTMRLIDLDRNPPIHYSISRNRTGTIVRVDNIFVRTVLNVISRARARIRGSKWGRAIFNNRIVTQLFYNGTRSDEWDIR